MVGAMSPRKLVCGPVYAAAPSAKVGRIRAAAFTSEVVVPEIERLYERSAARKLAGS
jgi:hypothetical protein